VTTIYAKLINKTIKGVNAKVLIEKLSSFFCQRQLKLETNTRKCNLRTTTMSTNYMATQSIVMALGLILGQPNAPIFFASSLLTRR